MRLWKSIGLMALVGGSATVLTACGSAPIPVATNFDYSTQQKARSAGHWDVMSRDVVVQSLQTLEGIGIQRNTPVYVALPKQASEFDQGFREMLLTKLVQSGVSVLDNNRGADLQISYATQVVVHKSDRPYFIPGQFTMLAGGLMAPYGLRTEHLDVKLLGTLGLAGAADFAASVNAGGPTHTEVILTTSVKRGDQYLARKTDVYYLEDADAPLFWKQVPATRFNVVDR